MPGRRSWIEASAGWSNYRRNRGVSTAPCKYLRAGRRCRAGCEENLAVGLPCKCHHYIRQGNCRFEDRCRYEHVTVSNSHVRRLHPNGKAPLCRHFSEPWRCRNSPCSELHQRVYFSDSDDSSSEEWWTMRQEWTSSRQPYHSAHQSDGRTVALELAPSSEQPASASVAVTAALETGPFVPFSGVGYRLPPNPAQIGVCGRRL